MKISAADLARYMTMHMNYGESHGIRIISEKSSREMQTPLSADENYGLALLKTGNYIPGKTLTGHTGSAYGLYSNMFPARRKMGTGAYHQWLCSRKPGRLYARFA
ncbi:MAG: hypothetical protein QM664_08365 [Flavihumibacter sp.]